MNSNRGMLEHTGFEGWRSREGKELADNLKRSKSEVQNLHRDPGRHNDEASFTRCSISRFLNLTIDSHCMRFKDTLIRARHSFDISIHRPLASLWVKTPS